MKHPSLLWGVTARRWLFDHGAHWTERIGDRLAQPWMRASRWCYRHWLAEREDKP